MSLQLHGWDIHAVCFGTGDAGVTKVRFRACAPPHAAPPHAAPPHAAPPHAAPEFIGIDGAAAPASMAELDAYYEQIRPRLSAGEEAEHAPRGIGR